METIALTYIELAERLHVQPESARKTTQRRKWRKYKGNDGLTRVEVPLDELPPPDPPPFVPGPTPEEIQMALRESHARLEAEVQYLREILARVDLSIAEQKAQIERWQAEALKWQEQAGSWQLEASMRRPGKTSLLDVLAFWRRSDGKGD
jgi:hypothetical protein